MLIAMGGVTSQERLPAPDPSQQGGRRVHEERRDRQQEQREVDSVRGSAQHADREDQSERRRADGLLLGLTAPELTQAGVGGPLSRRDCRTLPECVAHTGPDQANDDQPNAREHG